MNIVNILKVLLAAYWTDLALIAVFIAFICWLLKRGKKETVRRMVYNLVVKAEATLGSGTGDLKYTMVVAQIYEKLPWILRWLYTKKDIDNFITKSVEDLKIYLGQGKNLLGYSQEQKILELPPELIPSNAEINNIP